MVLGRSHIGKGPIVELVVIINKKDMVIIIKIMVTHNEGSCNNIIYIISLSLLQRMLYPLSRVTSTLRKG